MVGAPVRRAALALALAFLLATLLSARAFLFTPISGVIKAAAAYSGPGDQVSGASAWWGLRGYKSTFSGTVGNICDAATGLTCANMTWSAGVLTIPTIGGNACDNASHQCVVNSLADQTGNGFTIIQATNSARPTLIAAGAANGCPSTSLPCMGFVRASTQVLISPNLYTQSQPISIEIVGDRTGSTTLVNIGTAYGSSGSVGWSNAINTERAAAGAVLTASCADSSWHVIQDVLNGASSTLTCDSTSTNGSAGSNSASGVSFGVGGTGGSANTLDGKLTEAGLWPIAFSAGNISALNSNAHSYWGF